MTKILHIPSGQFITFEKAKPASKEYYTVIFEHAWKYEPNLTVEQNFQKYLLGNFRSNTKTLCNFFSHAEYDNRQINSAMFEIIYD